MKTKIGAAFAGLLLLAGCESFNGPYLDNSSACDEIVDARERLDCIDRAERAEDKWREERRRERDDKDREDASTP